MDGPSVFLVRSTLPETHSVRAALREFGVLPYRDGIFAARQGINSLRQNVPNPFNPSTFIDYRVPVSGTVRSGVYNTVGQLVRTLVQGDQSVGTYRVDWDGRDAAGRAVASGVYLYRLEMPQAGLVQTRYMSLVR